MGVDEVTAPGNAQSDRHQWVALMYHELEVAGRPLADADPGYSVYCVDRDAFRAHMDALVAAGLRATSIGEARSRATEPCVALTFDDGCETDWMAAVPILRDRGFGATFFVVAGFLGRRGYLSATQLRQVASAGFEIGSHSHSHRMLTTLGPEELHEELAGSRAKLEDVAGVAVTQFSCPHGRWSRTIERAAGRAGYETVSTSRPGVNTSRTPSTRLRRIAIRRGMGPEEIAALARGHGVWRTTARETVLAAGKRVLGEAAYAACRHRFIRLVRR